METIHVQYCPQANAPGGGENPPAEYDAVVLEVERPFCVTLRYAPDEGDEVTVQHVPAAGPRAADPIPGCYRPAKGAAFPVGYVEAMGAQAGGMAEADDDQPHG